MLIVLAGLEESIKTYKLLEGKNSLQFRAYFHLALRSNDKAGVDDALKTYSTQTKRPSFDKARLSPGSSYEVATPLHLAVQCASPSMVEYLLSRHKLDLSAKNRQGNTALHLAASQGRDEVVDLLLQQDEIDDSIVNHEGKQVVIFNRLIN
jgi:oxysterol-binding protein 1